MDATAWIAFSAVMLTVISFAAYGVNYVSRVELACQRQVEDARREFLTALSAAKEQHTESIAAAKELFSAIIEREMEKASKARHDMQNHIQTQIGGIDLDINRLRDRMVEMVHKTDLTASEARIIARFDKLEEKFERTQG